jgi:excinuclease ABC subunit C
MQSQNFENNLDITIKNLPQRPGVYRYFNNLGEVLYVGKAKNLKKRVSSYFQTSRPHNQRLALLVSQIQRIEYTEVKNEKEALILEANLIHNLQPRFNIQLKDDKSYLYVRITSDQIPGIFLTRKKYDPKSNYFGPYTKRYGIFSTLRTLRTIFPYCQQKTLQSKPCAYCQIKQCDGICVGKENIQDYNKKIEQIANVLQGRTDQVEIYIRQKMEQAITLNNFELASLWRDRLKILKETVGDQKIILPQPQDLDIITLIINDSESDNGLEIASVVVQTLRQGKMVNINNFLLVGTADNQQEYNDNKENEWLKEQDNNDFISDKAFNYFNKFLRSYYAQNPDKVKVLIQAHQVQNA